MHSSLLEKRKRRGCIRTIPTSLLVPSQNEDENTEIWLIGNIPKMDIFASRRLA